MREIYSDIFYGESKFYIEFRILQNRYGQSHICSYTLKAMFACSEWLGVEGRLLKIVRVFEYFQMYCYNRLAYLFQIGY